jgi:hypothetical protein
MKMSNLFRNVRPFVVSKNSWCIYADAFKRAAELIIESVEDTYDKNITIFPILYLYRQYVELTIKEIISYGKYMQGDNTQQGGHDLLSLWRSARSYIQKTNEKLSGEEYEKSMSKLENYIKKLHKLDPTSQATRYPCVKSKNLPNGSTLSFSNSETIINLDDLLKEINEVSRLFNVFTNAMADMADFDSLPHT